MRNLNFQHSALIPLLVCGVVASVACSSGSDTPATGPASGPGGAATSGTGTTSTATGAGGAPSTSTTSTTTNPTTSGTGGAGTGGTGSGTGGAGGSAGPSVCDGKGTRILTLADNKVDDFEGAMLLPGWSSFNDTMPVNSFQLMQAPGGAAGTAHAGHYAGMGAKTTGAMMGFGVGTIFNTAIDPSIGQYCIDISAFDGVAFWAKAAVDMSKVGVNFIVPATNPKPDPLKPELGGGDCVMPGCYNHPAKTITLGTTWKQYSVPFADAVGGGAGARVRNVIQMLGWLSPDSNWDFWVDEIQFYKGTASTGPIGGGDAGP
jgi:hypothetical protein